MWSAPVHLPCFSSGRKAVITGEDRVDFDGTIWNLRRSKTVPSMLRHLQRWEMQTPVECCVGKEWGNLRTTMDGMERVITSESKQFWSLLLQVHQLLGSSCQSMQLMQELQAFCVVVSQGAEDKVTTLWV